MAVLSALIIYVSIVLSEQSRFEVVSFDPQASIFFGILIRERHAKANEIYDKVHISLSEKIRGKMCHTVAVSSYFRSLEEEPVDNDEEGYRMLKTEHPSTFEKLRKESRTSPDEKELEHLTDVRWIDNIVAPEDVENTRTHSYVWTCVTRNRRTKKSKIFFITDEFNVAIDAPICNVPGHFILCPEGENEVVVTGIIERRAYKAFSDTKLMETRYLLSYRKNTKLALSPDTDPLCRLARLHKIRVCGRVIKSTFIRQEAAFELDESLFNEECNMREVSFRSRSVTDETRGKRFEEWMLWCPAKAIRSTIFTRSRVDYFVSRASKTGEAYVYSRASPTKPIHIIALFKEVSLISLVNEYVSSEVIKLG